MQGMARLCWYKSVSQAEQLLAAEEKEKETENSAAAQRQLQCRRMW